MPRSGTKATKITKITKSFVVLVFFVILVSAPAPWATSLPTQLLR